MFNVAKLSIDKNVKLLLKRISDFDVDAKIRGGNWYRAVLQVRFETLLAAIDISGFWRHIDFITTSLSSYSAKSVLPDSPLSIPIAPHRIYADFDLSSILIRMFSCESETHHFRAQATELSPLNGSESDISRYHISRYHNPSNAFSVLLLLYQLLITSNLNIANTLHDHFSSSMTIWW